LYYFSAESLKKNSSLDTAAEVHDSAKKIKTSLKLFHFNLIWCYSF